MAEVVTLPGQESQQPQQDELPLVSVIMPAYNEELVLASSLDRTYRYLQGQRWRMRFELLVVDDGSTDSTAAIADTFAIGRAEVRVLHLAVNGNLGKALRRGFSASRGDYVVTLDSDLTYDPAHIGTLLETLTTRHAHVAVASAYMPGGQVSGVPPVRLALSRGANRYLSIAVQGRLHTLTCMVRAYDGELVRNLSLRCSGTDINTEILYKAEVLGARIVEVPAHLDWQSAAAQAPGRLSSLRVGRSVGQYLRAGLAFRPSAPLALGAALCGSVAALCLASATALAARTAWQTDAEWTGRLAIGADDLLHGHVGLLVATAVFAILAVQLGGFALLARLAKHYFDELFDLNTRASWQHHDPQLWEPSTGPS